jgi:hypothetical protein
MFHSALVLLSSIATASADSHSQPTELDTPPIYIAARGAVAVPANTNGDVKTGGLAVGVEMDAMNSMGLRVIYMDDPPDNPLASSTPSIPWAWGPVIDWTHQFQPNSALGFYSNVSLGYVYGVPDDEPDADNVILPILEGGIGIRLSKLTQNGSRMFFSPELGFVPGAVAPYVAVSIGTIVSN